jgi:hypothetical protein
MADQAIRKRYGVDEILSRIPEDRGEFFVGFVPWPEDVAGWRRSTRESLGEEGDRSLIRTIWDDAEDRDARVLIDVVECDSAEDAVEALGDRLEGNQLPSLPPGPSGLGIASFMHPDFAPPAIFFARGNLAITVTSFGRKFVDVAGIAQRLNLKLGEHPTAVRDSLKVVSDFPSGRPGVDIPLRYELPAQKVDDGYLKLFLTGGTIARRKKGFVTRAKSPGRIDVEAYLVEPGRTPIMARAAIAID